MTKKSIKRAANTVAKKTSKSAIKKANKPNAVKSRIATERKKASKAVVVTEKAKDSGTLRKLDECAKEINFRLKKADENRITIALKIKEARKVCDDNNIGWEKWAKENLDWELTQVRDLLRVGKADDPEKALLTHRKKGAARVAKHAEKKKAALANAGAGEPKGPKKSPFMIAEEYLDKMTDKEQLAVGRARVEQYGFRLVEANELKGLRAKAEKAVEVVPPSVDGMLTLFDKMKPNDKVMFINAVSKTFEDDGDIAKSIRSAA